MELISPPNTTLNQKYSTGLQACLPLLVVYTVDLSRLLSTSAGPSKFLRMDPTGEGSSGGEWG